MEFLIEENMDQRLDLFLVQKTNFTRSYIKNLIDQGYIKINGIVQKSGKKLKPGDVVEVNEPTKQEQQLVEENININILYEDNDIIVINKSAGMVVHPAVGNWNGTVVNGILNKLDFSLNYRNKRPGIVHRLDKETSGVMVIAKNITSHLNLSQQFLDREIKKNYRAVVVGNLKNYNGIIKTNIGRNSKDRKKMSVTPIGKVAITEYNCIKNNPQYTYLDIFLHTGRTHQIRVHMKHIGHAIVGDELYGHKTHFHQLLHAYSLTITHPSTNKKMNFVAQLPDYFQDFIDKHF